MTITASGRASVVSSKRDRKPASFSSRCLWRARRESIPLIISPAASGVSGSFCSVPLRRNFLMLSSMRYCQTRQTRKPSARPARMLPANSPATPDSMTTKPSRNRSGRIVCRFPVECVRILEGGGRKPATWWRNDTRRCVLFGYSDYGYAVQESCAGGVYGHPQCALQHIRSVPIPGQVTGREYTPSPGGL